MGKVVPDGVRWVKDAVAAVDTATRTVTTGRGRRLRYTTLVVCPGTQRTGTTPRACSPRTRRAGPPRRTCPPPRRSSGRR
jgi:NADPH-dependent 2,4-dienoyl-CoA reductase/sulfur reductase-like enzyme